MKVKDLIKMLEQQEPEDKIIMKNLYCNPIEPSYFMKKIRVYERKGKVVIDGYDRRLEK
jgi:hypothetical protein